VPGPNNTKGQDRRPGEEIVDDATRGLDIDPAAWMNGDLRWTGIGGQDRRDRMIAKPLEEVGDSRRGLGGGTMSVIERREQDPTSC